MQLLPIEQDRLLVFLAAELARRRLTRGLRLSAPEAVAVIVDGMHEAARDGASYDDVMAVASSLLGADQVLEGVAELVDSIRVECLFDDGMRLLIVPNPIATGDAGTKGAHRTAAMDRSPPGAGTASAAVVTVPVLNRSNQPIWVGSHFPFFEVNWRLEYDRMLGWGRRLDLPAGDVQRFPPGESTTVSLVPIGGPRIVEGFNGLTQGEAREDRLPEGLARLRNWITPDDASTA